MRSPVLITGCARSGTSMVSGILNICGAFGGEMSGPTKYNRKGMFENARIRNEIVKPYLKEHGYDPLGQNPLPEPMDGLPTMDPPLSEQVEQIMEDQGYEEGVWFYKGAKMCLVWPLWNLAFPGAEWVIVRRKDEDIVNSCLHTTFMKAFHTPKGWQGWVDAHKRRFQEMHNAGLKITEIWPEKFVQSNDFHNMKHLVEKLRLVWNEKEIIDFIEPAWWSVHRREEKHG